MSSLIASAAPANGAVTPAQVAEIVAAACPAEAYRGQRVLLIIPDGTRTARWAAVPGAPRSTQPVARAFDLLVALGTHRR